MPGGALAVQQQRPRVENAVTKVPASDVVETIGLCVVFLGSLNQFVPVNEALPIVSRIGTIIGTLQIAITPLVAPETKNGTREVEAFRTYVNPRLDDTDERLEDLLDRTVLYRLSIVEITGLTTRKHTQLGLRYSFFRDDVRQTEWIPITDQTAVVNYASNHIIDVTESAIQYITNHDLPIEVRINRFGPVSW